MPTLAEAKAALHKAETEAKLARYKENAQKYSRIVKELAELEAKEAQMRLDVQATEARWQAASNTVRRLYEERDSQPKPLYADDRPTDPDVVQWQENFDRLTKAIKHAEHHRDHIGGFSRNGDLLPITNRIQELERTARNMAEALRGNTFTTFEGSLQYV